MVVLETKRIVVKRRSGYERTLFNLVPMRVWNEVKNHFPGEWHLEE
jgi:hypothetical protein